MGRIGLAYGLNKVVHVICEGASEVAYLNELNRLFRESDKGLILRPHKAVNGSYVEIRRKYQEVWKNDRKGTVQVLVDRDVYERSPNERLLYSNHDKDHLPDFLFNYMNMEDFLVLHLSHGLVVKWNSICREKGHFQAPLCSDSYIPILNSSRVLAGGDYRKGSIPFEVSFESLSRLFENNRNPDFGFHSDFAEFLEEILNNC